MQHVIAHPDGILTVDVEPGHAGRAAVHFIIHRGQVAIVDSGTNASVPGILAALEQAGVGVADVAWVILTHIHLDHAGGVGRLMRHLPAARLLVHPRGVRHMIDPGRLWEANARVYGEEQARALYGVLEPVAPERIVAATEGYEVALGDRVLRVLDLPGHTRHHIGLWDEAARAFFAGDTFGVSYRELDVERRSFVFPSTMPSEFDPDALHASIERIRALQPEAVYLGHFSRVSGVERLTADLHRLIDAQVAVARAARGHGVARHVEIIGGLEQIVRDETERQGWALDNEAAIALLRLDLDMNAHGLGVWLDRCPAPGSVAA